MVQNVVIVGGGVGGTITANLLDKQLGSRVKVTVVDRQGKHFSPAAERFIELLRSE